jgi:subtilisin family serine protease
VRLLGGKSGPFHLSSLAAWLEHSTVAGSIPFPGDGAEWVTVGAVDAQGRRAVYSSCGPNSSRPKPEAVAAVPFPSAIKGRSFSGTSAAAPQAAGLAALVRSQHPDWPAAKIRATLLNACRDLGAPGYDTETGFGLMRLP